MYYLRGSLQYIWSRVAAHVSSLGTVAGRGYGVCAPIPLLFLSLKKMRNYKRRVQIQSSTGRYLFSVPRDKARAMVSSGDAAPPEKSGAVWCLILLNIPLLPPSDVIPSQSVHSLLRDQRTVYRERTSNPGRPVYQFRRLYGYDSAGNLVNLTKNNGSKIHAYKKETSSEASC